MPDLEQRLRDDSARPESIVEPDFGHALDAAVRSRASRRRPHAAIAGAAAAVVLLGTTLALLRHDSTTPLDSASSRHHPAAGQAAPVLGVIAATRGQASRRLVVIARNSAPGCTQPRLRVRETASRVLIGVDELEMSGSGPARLPRANRTPVPAGGPATGSGLGPPAQLICGNAPFSELIAHLRHRVGSREVIDANSGDGIALLHGPVPSPHPVPQGYREVATYAGLDEAPLDANLGSFYPVALTRTYTKDGGDRMDVVSAVSWTGLHAARVVGHVSVGTHRATESVAHGVRCIDWRVAAERRRQVCAAGPTALGFGELTKVARDVSD